MSWLDSPTLSNLAAPSGVLAGAITAAVTLYRHQRGKTQEQHDTALATTPPPEPDTDLLEASERVVIGRITRLEEELAQSRRDQRAQFQALWRYVSDLVAFINEHPCSHDPRHPVPTVPLDVLAGVIGVQRPPATPPGGMPAVPQES